MDNANLSTIWGKNALYFACRKKAQVLKYNHLFPLHLYNRWSLTKQRKVIKGWGTTPVIVWEVLQGSVFFQRHPFLGGIEFYFDTHRKCA